jgi:hypothetical protein
MVSEKGLCEGLQYWLWLREYDRETQDCVILVFKLRRL